MIRRIEINFIKKNSATYRTFHASADNHGIALPADSLLTGELPAG
jgi:hypothetical protein